MTAWGAALVGARVLPLVALAPFLGGSLPASVRLAVAFALAAALWPLGAPPPDAGPALLVLLAVKEAAVGATLGFVSSLVFWAAATAGRLAETASGLPRLATLHRLLAVVIFFGVGGHRLVLAAWWRSYEVVPVGSFVAAASFPAAAGVLLRLTGDLIAVALGLAAPVLAATLLADLFAAAVARFAPEISVAMLALPVRALAGLGTLALGSLVLARALGTGVRGAATATDALLRVLR